MNEETEQRNKAINEAINFFRKSRIDFGELLALSQKNRVARPSDKILEPIAKTSAKEIAKDKAIIAALEKGDIKPAIRCLEAYVPELPSEKYSDEIAHGMREIRGVYYRLKQFDISN